MDCLPGDVQVALCCGLKQRSLTATVSKIRICFVTQQSLYLQKVDIIKPKIHRLSLFEMKGSFKEKKLECCVLFWSMLGILVEMLLEWTRLDLVPLCQWISAGCSGFRNNQLRCKMCCLCHYEVMLELQQNHENSGYTKLVGGSNFEPI